ncbi:MAG: hypothetical protein JWO44_823 [Bacteroidetes bacterium]|nr:hypothetical protein [Bacteroidota bacterium]
MSGLLETRLINNCSPTNFGRAKIQMYSKGYKCIPENTAYLALIICKSLILSTRQIKRKSPKQLVLSDELHNFIVKPNFY